MFNTIMSHQSGRMLRRVWSLGFLAERLDNEYWQRTGHAVMMDMGRGRNKHPWIILASEWPDSNGEDDDQFTTRVMSEA